ncbi:hypothetical protein [Streptomyces cyaneofuscatus]|uniref:hypothetical protein n=1 Tax=Streptomyces cyaneofuscatus TaxID=66883 RepID=UPI0036DD79B7
MRWWPADSWARARDCSAAARFCWTAYERRACSVRAAAAVVRCFAAASVYWVASP